MNKQPGTSAAPLLLELGWISLEDKRRVHKCVMMHKLLKGNGPKVLMEKLERYINVERRTTRDATNKKLATVAHNTDYITKSYFYDTIKVWNQLPSRLRQIENTKTFKENLQKHLLHHGR